MSDRCGEGGRHPMPERTGDQPVTCDCGLITVIPAPAPKEPTL